MFAMFRSEKQQIETFQSRRGRILTVTEMILRAIDTMGMTPDWRRFHMRTGGLMRPKYVMCRGMCDLCIDYRFNK